MQIKSRTKSAERMLDAEKDQLTAIGFRVLVELDPVSGQSESGLITMTEGQTEKEKRGQCTGTIVSIGPLAFSVEGGAEKWGEIKIGDRVGFQRYEGDYFDPYVSDPEDHAGYRSIDYTHLSVKLENRSKKKCHKPSK